MLFYFLDIYVQLNIHKNNTPKFLTFMCYFSLRMILAKVCLTFDSMFLFCEILYSLRRISGEDRAILDRMCCLRYIAYLNHFVISFPMNDRHASFHLPGTIK